MSFQSKFNEFLKKDYTMALNDSDDQHIDSNEDMDYSEKCSKLFKRCQTIKSENERLINNIYNTKKLSKKVEKQKKILIKRLTKYRVDYKNYDLPLFLESEGSPQKAANDIKCKNLMTKSNCNPTHPTMSSKNKKSKPNNSRNESTSNGNSCVAPKKPINPYLLFCQENRSSVQENYHLRHQLEMTHQELTKALAQQWHELSLTDKQVYYNLFNDEKVRYENQMKLFTANKESNDSCD